MNWFEHKGGRLAIGPRPGRRSSLPKLEKEGCDYIVSILGKKEQPEVIQRAAETRGWGWYHIPMPSAKPPPEEYDELFRDDLARLTELLEDGHSVYLHCSAGLHRTGMIAEAWLMQEGVEDPLKTLREMREQTADEMTFERSVWAHRVANHLYD